MRNRYVDIEDRTQDLRDRLQEDPAVAADFHHKFELTLLHHENALEGVVYTIQELDSALRGVTVAEASVMNGYRDIVNHEEAFAVVREEGLAKKPKVTLALLKKLHELLIRGFEGKEPVDLRAEMPLHRTYFHEIAQPAKIPALLAKLMELVDSADFRSLHAVQKSSRFQFELMRIFPYTENSGRIARLVGTLYLVAGSLDPVVVHAVDRQRYYEAFRLGEPQLRELLLESYENQLANAEKFSRQALADRRRFRSMRA